LAVSCASLLVPASVPGQTSPTATTPPSKSTPGTPRSKPATTPAHKRAAPQKTSARHRKSRKTTASWRKQGQQKIDPQRASEIQEALIREHYLTGSASGVWDDATQKALLRYQSDNGWQDKTTPDARALIKLGLGPDRQHLLNPDSAMTATPQPETPRPAADPPDGNNSPKK
jgi:hypothetical protein